MKISSIAVCYERRFNLGDFNSLKLETTAWADMEEGDDPEVCKAKLHTYCRESVRAEYQRLRGQVPSGQTVEARNQIADPALANVAAD